MIESFKKLGRNILPDKRKAVAALVGAALGASSLAGASLAMAADYTPEEKHLLKKMEALADGTQFVFISTNDITEIRHDFAASYHDGKLTALKEYKEQLCDHSFDLYGQPSQRRVCDLGVTIEGADALYADFDPNEGKLTAHAAFSNLNETKGYVALEDPQRILHDNENVKEFLDMYTQGGVYEQVPQEMRAQLAQFITAHELKHLSQHMDKMKIIYSFALGHKEKNSPENILRNAIEAESDVAGIDIVSGEHQDPMLRQIVKHARAMHTVLAGELEHATHFEIEKQGATEPELSVDVQDMMPTYKGVWTNREIKAQVAKRSKGFSSLDERDEYKEGLVYILTSKLEGGYIKDPKSIKMAEMAIEGWQFFKDIKDRGYEAVAKQVADKQKNPSGSKPKFTEPSFG